MWGAAWLLKATNDLHYKNFIESLGDGDQPDIFNWDNKYAGAYVLLSQVCLVLILTNCGSFVLSQAQSQLFKILYQMWFEPEAPLTHQLITKKIHVLAASIT